MVAAGLARPVPAMSGAEPWIASNRPGPAGAERRRRREADAAADGRGEVGQDVAEHVLGDDDVVGRRLLDELHRHRVDELVAELDVGVVGRDLGRRTRRHSAGRVEHVRLVDGAEQAAPLARQRERAAGDALDLGARVDAGVERAVVAELLARRSRGRRSARGRSPGRCPRRARAAAARRCASSSAAPGARWRTRSSSARSAQQALLGAHAARRPTAARRSAPLRTASAAWTPARVAAGNGSPWRRSRRRRTAARRVS